jgi:hypothetical protein
LLLSTDLPVKILEAFVTNRMRANMNKASAAIKLVGGRWPLLNPKIKCVKITSGKPIK